MLIVSKSICHSNILSIFAHRIKVHTIDGIVGVCSPMISGIIRPPLPIYFKFQGRIFKECRI